MFGCRYKTSLELVSHDTHNNTYQYKQTFSHHLKDEGVASNSDPVVEVSVSKHLTSVNYVSVYNHLGCGCR